MAFDWVSFLERYGVDHVTSGHNARRGWVGVKCPWCADDPSHHLGVSLSKGIYHCWRNEGHSGRSPYRLISALLNCSHSEAAAIYGSAYLASARSDDIFDEPLRRLGVVISEPRFSSGELRPLPEFTPIRDSGLCRTLALPYLERRGYDLDGALVLADRYGLMFAASGAFSYRIIVPIVVDGRLVNWTGRSVASSESLRYKSLSTDAEKAAAQGLPVASRNIKDVLFDLDDVRRGGEMLLVAEGPFDAMRLGFLGKQHGVRATCLFGKAATPAQVDLLAEIRDRYDEVVSLFDRDAGLESFVAIPDDLRIRPRTLPAGVKDPAELSERQFIRMFVDA